MQTSLAMCEHEHLSYIIHFSLHFESFSHSVREQTQSQAAEVVTRSAWGMNSTEWNSWSKYFNNLYKILYSYKIVHVTKHIQNQATCSQQFANRIHGINYMLEISLNSSDLYMRSKILYISPKTLLNKEIVEIQIWSLCTLPFSRI